MLWSVRLTRCWALRRSPLSVQVNNLQNHTPVTDTAGLSIAAPQLVPFTLASASTIDTILASIAGSCTYNLRIVANSSGLPTGAVLYTRVLTNPVANTLISGLGWSLAVGSYWLEADAPSSASGT